MIAAVLGPRLSEDWTAEQVVRLLQRYAGVHSLLGPDDAYAPLCYLARLLDRALTNPEVQLYAASPVATRARRERSLAERDALLARQAARRAEWAERHALLAADPAAAAQRQTAAATAAQAGDAWPTPRQPGAGLPPERTRQP